LGARLNLIIIGMLISIRYAEIFDSG
jgi:hypothetical protein